MYIIKNKESNVNRCVNEILIKMRDYLYDMIDSYNNSLILHKIKNKELISKVQFKSLKFNNIENKLIKNYNLPENIEYYFNKYNIFYNDKYPNRGIEFDITKTTLIISTKFDIIYYIHLALIQYIVLDVIYKKQGDISLNEISTVTKISIDNLEDSVNSLLKVKLIKKKSNIEDIILSINNEFTMKDNKISISSLIIKDKEFKKTKELLHDRQTIVYCNIIDFIKKNSVIYEDTIIEQLQFKIPFNLTSIMISNALENALNNNHIEKVILTNKFCVDQIVYKLI